MAQDKKSALENVEAHLAAVEQAADAFKASLSQGVTTLQQTIATTEELVEACRKSGADPKQLLDLYISAFQSFKKPVENMAAMLSEVAMEGGPEMSQPGRAAIGPKPSGRAPNPGNGTEGRPNPAGPHPVASYTPGYHGPRDAGSVARPSARAAERMKAREAERLAAAIKAKRYDLYERIRFHADFDFYKKIEDELETAGVSTLKFREAQSRVEVLKAEKETLKQEILGICEHVVKRGGPLHVARSGGHSTRNKVIGIIDKTNFPANYWDVDCALKQAPAAGPRKAGGKP